MIRKFGVSMRKVILFLPHTPYEFLMASHILGVRPAKIPCKFFFTCRKCYCQMCRWPRCTDHRPVWLLMTLCYGILQHSIRVHSSPPFFTIFYNILQYSTVFYNILQYNTLRYSTVCYNILQCSTRFYSFLQDSKIVCHILQYVKALCK